jgi:NAD(P)-dependent dehydrogenase (short-subunit alcohol dehydrogenase family)
MLKDKVAVIYGGGGAIGGTAARAFGSEGARVFLTGRTLAPVEVVAKEIVSAGGLAEAVAVDAGTPFVGGGAPAMAAVEALTRDLSAELAPQGIRVVGLRPQGIPETPRIRKAFGLYAEASGMSWERF